MRICVCAGVAKHELELEASDTVGGIKSKIVALLNIPIAEQKLLVKGKQPKDSCSVADLGLKHGMKVMLLGAKPGAQVPSRAVDAPLPVSAMPVVVSEKKAAPAEEPIGSGTILLAVSHGVQKYRLRCESGESVLELKQLLAKRIGAPVLQQRLIYRGKELSDSASVGSIGIEPKEGSATEAAKLMLLFREGYHLQQEGDAIVVSAKSSLAALRARWEQINREIKGRLLDGPAALSELGLLEHDLGALVQDLKNTVVGAEQVHRAEQLRELESLASSVRVQRGEISRAELNTQLGR